MVRLPAGSWHGLPCWSHGLCMKCVVKKIRGYKTTWLVRACHAPRQPVQHHPSGHFERSVVGDAVVAEKKKKAGRTTA